MKDKIKSLIRSFPVICGASAAALLFTVLTFILGPLWLAIVELAADIAVVVYLIVNYDLMSIRKQKMITHISSELDQYVKNISDSFPLPIIICSPDGKIEWFNERFEQAMGPHSSGYGELSSLFENVGIDSILDASVKGVVIDCDDKSFNVFSHRVQVGESEYVVMYLVDITKYRSIANDYFRCRPALAIMTIDNMSEIQQDHRESDCSAIRNGVEKNIETWLSKYPCLISKISDNSFYVVAEKQDIDDMISRKFDILDKIRNYTYDGKYVGVTLSVGVGTGADVAECEKNAKLSLDMALGRGGDQVVIKNKDKYDFFGGVSKSVETGSKVKSRVVASALSELIQGCENVYVMGHRFPDFDATGSAFGVVCIAKKLGKNAFLVTDKDNGMAKPLIERAETEFPGVVMPTRTAKLEFAKSKKNLLIVVDTHIKNFVECPELLAMSRMTIVIDHHRKAVDYIDDAVIFFHDPSASSASEMVTELIEYIPAVDETGSFVADALLSGIMLDTKNFILRVGVGTFEAAARLKDLGADPVRVKRLFSNDIENYHERNQIVDSAKKYKNCAIAVADVESKDIRLISAQAADELLSISGVDASFVIFNLGDAVCVSARSFGAVNVQVVMEYMNGGGHQTMAAVQVKNSTVAEVTEQVMRSIDRYNESLNKSEV
ncbi:MAG TPA: DHH family phosphoesterase [Oscillospiraceae bacterium]|nr:DHH family phosphoesterase [Oscillospiraceae bacterium]